MAYTTIDDPSEYFQIALYTGSDDASATKVVTNDGNSDLQPDWLWFKRRNASANHAIQDTSRGIGNGISILIFVSIVSGLPGAVGQALEQTRQGETSLLFLFALLFFFSKQT